MAEKRTIELEVKDNAQSLKAQYREAVQELQRVSAQYGETSQEAIKAAKAAAELKDQIGFSKDLVDSFNPDAKFNSLTRSIGGVLDGFQAFEGALGLVGVEGEAVQQTMLKVQSAMALSQGLQGVFEARDSFKQLGSVVTNAFGSMTAAGKAFAVTGIGLVVAALGYAITNWDKLKGSINAQTAAQKTSNQVMAQATASIQNEVSAADKLSRQLKDETLTRQQKLQKVKEFQAAYPGLLKNVNLETMSIAQINGQLEKNIQLLKLQAQVKAIEAVRAEKLQEKVKTQLDEVALAQENATRWTIDFGETAANGWVGFSSAADNAKKAQQDFTKIQTVGTKAIDNDVKALDKQSLALEKQIMALEKQGAETGNTISSIKDYSSQAASFTTATNSNTSAIDKKREALEKLRDLQQRISEAEKEYLNSLLSQEEQEKQAVKDKYEALIREADKYDQDSMLLREALEKGLSDIDKKYRDLEKEEQNKKRENEKKENEDRLKEANENGQKEFDLWLKGIENRNEAELLIATGQQEELLKNRIEFNKQLDRINELQINGAFKTQEEYNEALLNLEKDFQKKDKDVKDKYQKEEIERRNALRQKTLELAGNTFSALSDLAGSFNAKNEQQAKRQFLIQKAFNLGAAITNTAMAVTGALTAGGNALKLATGQQFVEAGIAAAVGTANIIKIANSRFGGSQGSGGGGGNDVPTPQAPMTAQFNTIGMSGINQLATLQQQPVQAYVVSGQVTSAQSLDRNRIQNATL